MVKSNFSLPDDMKFGEAQIIAIIAYSIMFIIGLTLNSISLYQLLKDRLMRKTRNRMSLLLIHLSVADLLVSIILLLAMFVKTLSLTGHFTASTSGDSLDCHSVLDG